MQSERVYDGDDRGYLTFFTEEHPYIGGLDEDEIVVDFHDDTDGSTVTYWFKKEELWQTLSSVLQD